MKKESEFSQYFDDDFEVTYDEYMTDTDIAPRSRRTSGYNQPDPDTESWDMPDDTDDIEDYDTDYDDEDTLPGSVKQKKLSKKRRSRGVPLAAPIRKGGRTLSRLASALVRSLTAVLILAVTVYVMWTFWRASTPYGDILEALETMRYMEGRYRAGTLLLHPGIRPLLSGFSVQPVPSGRAGSGLWTERRP